MRQGCLRPGAPADTVPIFWRVVRTAPADQDAAAINRAIDAFGRVLDIAEAQPARHAFRAGPAFTLADIQLGHLPRRYYDALSTRPAFREHVMVSYEELRVN